MLITSCADNSKNLPEKNDTDSNKQDNEVEDSSPEKIDSNNETAESPEKKTNDINYLIKPSDNLSDDWESLEFFFFDRTYNILGKEFKEISSIAPYKAYEDKKMLIPGDSLNVGFKLGESGESEKYSFTLTLFNTKPYKASI